ncbi:MAG TPA: alanine racemase [Micropepsaceae bacterium]|nr:alanine racemase [Micropepsaceae bacterium]
MSKSGPESAQASDHSLAHLTVRLGSVAANYREVLRRAPSASAAPVVKANAYGMGLAPVTHALSNAGADSFFVARLEEGIEARALLPHARIFVFDGVAPGTASALVSHRLTPVLNSLEEITEWSMRAKADRVELDAVLQIDTGMNRSGLSHAELSQLASRVRESLVGINLVLILSHLALADEPDREMNWVQLARFRAALAALPAAPASLSASAGIELGRDFHFDMVRPGLAIYGGKPVQTRPNPYRTVAVLTGCVLQIRHIDEGETVGYAATFTAARPSRLAIVATGYADGLIRAGAARGRAAIAGVRVPFAGRMSMDLLALDATDVPLPVLNRGTEVEFMGDTVTLEEVAEAAGTITHEVLTSISPRARRIYVDE